MTKTKEQQYEVERQGAVEYVVVRCPQGHRLRGMKADDMELRQRVACSECEAVWTVLAPMTNGLEACV